MKELAPDDASVVDEVVSVARRFAHFDIMGLATASALERLMALRMAPTLMKYGSVTLEQIAKRFVFGRHGKLSIIFVGAILLKVDMAQPVGRAAW